MAYSTINKSTDYFNTKLWSGNGSTNAISGIGFQPDWVWNKALSGGNVNDHRLIDAVRGATKNIYSNATTAEETDANGLTAFNTDGFTMGNSNGMNNSSTEYVSWTWRAGGSGGANTDGTINSTVSANTTSGFSICKFVGNATQGASVGHGLGVAPNVIFTKNLTQGNEGWMVYHSSLGNTKKLSLNEATGSASSNTYWYNTSPDTTKFTLGSNWGMNGNSHNMIAYCFANKTGYQKAGKYIGNGNVNGEFIYTGFAPKYVLLKKDGGDGWWIVDDKQANPLPNPNTQMIVANTSNGNNNSVSPFIDIYSSGFKLRSTWSGVNASGSDYVYLAIGQSLVGSNNIPCVAR